MSTESYVALYRSREGGSAKLIAVAADPAAVAYVAAKIISERRQRDYDDPVASALELGRLKALKAIRRQALEAKRHATRFDVIDGLEEALGEAPEKEVRT